MKVEKYLLKSFEEQEHKESITVSVPTGSNFLSAEILHDGIYVWYSIPDLVIESTKEEKFVIVKPGQSIANDSTFVAILNTVMETPKGQAIIIFPLFKLN